MHYITKDMIEQWAGQCETEDWIDLVFYLLNIDNSKDTIRQEIIEYNYEGENNA